MPSILNSDDGVVSGTSGLKTTGGNDGLLNIQTNGSTALSVNASQQVTFNNGANLPNTFGFKNRLINGGMVIDQRNAGASLNPADFAYSLDRWKCRRSQASKFTVQQNAGSVTPPAGFSNYLGVTSSSAYSVLAADYFVIQQIIEGFNFADFAYGTANAATLTLSFWVRSSLTGTFGGALQNNAENRSYGFTYTISAANTWEQKTITIVGDTSGTWIGATNGNGLYVNFNLGTGSTYGAATNGAWASGTTAFTPSGTVSVVGTNAATWYITGVQLERGSAATSFDFRSYGTELALCQRYYYRVVPDVNAPFGVGWNVNTTQGYVNVPFPIVMRVTPTAVEQNGTAANYRIRESGGGFNCSAVVSFVNGSPSNSFVIFTVASGLTAGRGCFGESNNAAAYLAWSAEL
jgi:hypothetical protein